MQEQKAHGAVLPVADLRTDLENTPFGNIFKAGNMFVDYVVIAATAQQEPQVRNAKGGASVLMLYQKVKPMFGAQNPFDLEAVTSIAKCHEFNMGDKKPRLIVGTVAYSADGNEITLLAERIFPLDPADGKFFYKEMEQLHSTLSGDRIETVAKKRPADDLWSTTRHTRCDKDNCD